MPAPSVVIISKDRDFSESVVEQVKRELSVVCRVADEAGDAGLIVTDAAGKYDGAVLLVKKPVRMSALLQDIEVALQKSPDEITDLGKGYALQMKQKKLTHKNALVDVTDKEAQLLHSLALVGKKGVTKEQLLKEVWGIEADLNTHTLETHIYRLRGKLRELAGEEMIIAIDGGYKLGK